MSKPFVKVYYVEDQYGQWKLTKHKRVAQQYLAHRLATYDDLNDWSCLGGIFQDAIIHIEEGFFEWIHKTRVDCFGLLNYGGEYVEVTNLKDRLLNVLEDMEMQDSDEYKTVTEWTNWRTRKFLERFSQPMGNIDLEIMKFESLFEAH